MRQFLDILLDGSSILGKVKALRLERRRDQAVDVLTLELADYSLYSQLDFGAVPASERIQVATAKGDPKTDGSTSATAVLTSASSGFIADGVTTDDLLMVLTSAIAADIGTWPITNIAATQLTSSHSFGNARGIEFIVLKNQGRFFVEKPDVLEDKNQLAIPSLWGRCGLARMIDPFAGKITRSYGASTTFYDLVKDLVALAGMDSTKVQFDIDDFAIPANIYSVSNQYPLQVAIDLASKSNGIVRCDKNGNLWVQKDLYHFAALPVAQALGDGEIDEMREHLEYPQFGNRILIHSSVSSGGMNVRVRLRLDTGCIRGNGTASTRGEAVVTDGAGNMVSDGTPVDWSIDNPNLATWGPSTSLTGSRGISGELQSASDLTKVGTDYPIRSVLGVYLENDSNRATNFFTGGSFAGSEITLGFELPFTDSRVLIDYVGAGIAVSTLQSLKGAPETKTFVHAAVGKIRDSQEFCINNDQNISISLHASKTEYNLCKKEESMISDIVGQVKIDGDPGTGAMVAWKRAGDAGGQLSPSFSTVKNLALEETTTSENNFTVHTQNEISSVTGVWLVASGKSGANYYSSEQNRKKKFSGTEITLGTNLPEARMPVIVAYTAPAAVKAQYTGPTKIGKDVITATLRDGSSTPESASVDIDAINDCTEDGSGGGGTETPQPPEEPCTKSSASAQSCCGKTFPNAIDSSQAECICREELGGAGGCPTTEAGCQALCERIYAKDGINPFDGDEKPAGGKSAAEVSCAKQCAGDPACMPACLADHRQQTIERCKQDCLDHGIQISPKSGSINCAGAKKISFTVSGGTPPYSWGATVGGVAQSGINGEKADLTPPPNPGSGVAGTAYKKVTRGGVGPCAPGMATGFCAWAEYNCADTATVSCTEAIAVGDPSGCGEDFGTCVEGDCATELVGFGPCASKHRITGGAACPVASPSTQGAFCDKRTPSMIADGCNPCQASMQAGSVVTVRDSRGKSASAVVTA